MRNFCKIILTVCLLHSASIFDLQAEAFKAEYYTSVDNKTLKLKPEDYRNKKIFYEGFYSNIMTTFPAYAEKNGIKAGKYFWLIITPENLPVIVRKGDDLDDVVIAIKKGSTVKVYGKVRKFKYQAKHTMLPLYYLEMVHIEVVKEPEKEPEEGNDRRNPFKRPRRRLIQ